MGRVEEYGGAVDRARAASVNTTTRGDQSVQPRYAATERRVMQVGPIRFHGHPLPPVDACDHIKFGKFFTGARLALCLRASQGRLRYAGRYF
jgi:hypothetical protein